METTKKKISSNKLNDTLDPTYYSTIIAILIVLITLFIFVYRKRRSARRGVLIMGLSNSGKTLLYARLLTDKFIATFSSIKENSGDYSTERGVLTLIDIPGSERVRRKYFDQYKSSARAIIFAVDSSTIQAEIKDTAELLHSILTDNTLASNRVKILILCNKQDEPNAKSCDEVESLLTDELNVLISTKSRELESISDSGNKQVLLCQPGKSFDFSKSCYFSIDFTESSLAENSTDGYTEIENWIESRVV